MWMWMWETPYLLWRWADLKRVCNPQVFLTDVPDARRV